MTSLSAGKPRPHSQSRCALFQKIWAGKMDPKRSWRVSGMPQAVSAFCLWAVRLCQQERPVPSDPSSFSLSHHRRGIWRDCGSLSRGVAPSSFIQNLSPGFSLFLSCPAKITQVLSAQRRRRPLKPPFLHEPSSSSHPICTF